MHSQLKDHLSEFGQEHLIADVDRLSLCEQESCVKQINRWDKESLKKLKTSWLNKDSHKKRSTDHFLDLSVVHASEIPQSSHFSARVAVLILAGGQGSRLGMSGPKGCFSILGKSLFEWHIQKIKDPETPVVILTSPLNHSETQSFFAQHQFFGLKEIQFCIQGTFPLLDEEGRWFWESPGRIAEGPDGNGSVFSALERSGAFHLFLRKQISLIQILPIDNPAAPVDDPSLFQWLLSSQSDLVIRSIFLSDPQEQMGRFVKDSGKLRIVEFAELSDEERKKHLQANTGLFTLNVNFAQKLINQPFSFHWARRNALHWKSDKVINRPAWKAERFITDAVEWAKNPRVVCFERDKCYVPIKDQNSIPAAEKLGVSFHQGSSLPYSPIIFPS